MIELDGSHGEGGGQILRSALALSLLTGQPFKLVNIRANRPKPGLAPQHLACVRAAATIGKGFFKGGSVGSSVLYFDPGEVRAGNYDFRIGTAGSTALVLHTVYLPLALRGQTPSRVTITGGTHVMNSPSYHYLAITWAAHLRQMGIEVELELVRPGFYPRGGGEIRAVIHPCSRVRGQHLVPCPDLTTAGGFSAVAGLPESIAKRQARRVTELLKRANIESHIPCEEWDGGPSSVTAILFRQLAVPPLFLGLGERGKPAEVVADEVAREALNFRESQAPVDPYAGDQILLPLVFAADSSEYRVSETTHHLTTNRDTIQHFVDRPIVVQHESAGSGLVQIAGRKL